MNDDGATKLPEVPGDPCITHDKDGGKVTGKHKWEWKRDPGTGAYFHRQECANCGQVKREAPQG